MPQERKPPPIEHAHRITAAVQALADAKVERDEAIADALKAGGSIREVAQFAGMSTRSIQLIGHANGWPTPKQVKAREEAAAERAKWDAYLTGRGQVPSSE